MGDYEYFVIYKLSFLEVTDWSNITKSHTTNKMQCSVVSMLLRVLSMFLRVLSMLLRVLSKVLI